MKVVILAGGRGTRLEEDTRDLVPKPMVDIGGVPMVEHIIRLYQSQGTQDFIIAAGHLGNVLEDWARAFQGRSGGAKVTVVDTGENTATGGRVARLRALLGNDRFFLTYGDGLADVNLTALVRFHERQGGVLTLTAVRPPNRFGYLDIERGVVTRFAEKPQDTGSWVNGGFYVVEPDVIDLISGDNCQFERDVLPVMAQLNELTAFKHEGFWQCVDHPRERRALEDLYQSGQAPWLRWEAKGG
jgi:glucose-1-phosphate cytidylyltransferase